MRRIVVTGAGGYLGSRIVADLSASCEVVGLVRTGAPSGGRQVALEDRAAVAGILAEVRPYHVIHAAGRVSGEPGALHRDNVATTRTLAEAVLEAAPDAVLTILGSAAEYGPGSPGRRLGEDTPCRPLTDYGRAKLAATLAARDLRERRGLRLNVVRPFNLVAAPMSAAQVLGTFVARAHAAREQGARRVAMGPLGATRDFVAVADLVSLLRALVRQDADGVVVNCCSGEGTCVRDLVSALNRLPGGGFMVDEEGAPSVSPNVVIGDPRLQRSIFGPREPTPIEPILREAWRLAMKS